MLRRSALLAVVLLSAAASAQETLGRADFIVGVQTVEGEPVAGATVLVGDRGASTDTDGEAVISDLAPGRYRVRVSFLGRETRELAARLDVPGPWGLIVELAPSSVALADVVVTASDLRSSRLATDGFFERLRLGAGTVLTLDHLERRSPILLTDALRGVLGVVVRRGAFGPVAVSNVAGEECRLTVFLDGMPSSYASDNLDAVSAQDVVAVEVYRRPSEVPIRYNQLGVSDGCGVILVWTSFSLSERQ